MTHPVDHIDHQTILALKWPGRDAADAVLLAHYARGGARLMHIRDALREADKMIAAAARLRAEVERIEAADIETA